MAKGISVLKFVGTVSLGLLTASSPCPRFFILSVAKDDEKSPAAPPPLRGVSYTVSAVTLPTLLQLPSSSSAAHALASLQSSLRTPVLALSSLAAAPLFLSFACSPRYARHPYLFYTSILAVLSVVVPGYLPQPAAAASKSTGARKTTSSRARMEASYEVVGDSHSDGDLPSESELEDVNGEEVRANVEGVARAYLVKTGFAAAAFVLSVVGLWGDGAPRTVRYY
ncbi:hypothetical protein TrVGV298_008925 [Trichoderma virens]|nr:hypothetical protein TrVGV298_008925 [Trichoderma virens]